MPRLSKSEALAVMRRTGHHADLDRARAILPDEIDTDRDADLLLSLGLTKSGLMEDMGDSP